uniref:Uncharacterized protein n=1 Tax=viral metagenome TaxID=1070528 RepID=A0A6C0ETQ7_9ZZZZ
MKLKVNFNKIDYKFYNSFHTFQDMYIIGCQVYEDEEIMPFSLYSSIYEQDPEDYIMEEFESDYDKMANEFMTKMKIKQSQF